MAISASQSLLSLAVRDHMAEIIPRPNEAATAMLFLRHARQCASPAAVGVRGFAACQRQLLEEHSQERAAPKGAFQACARRRAFASRTDCCGLGGIDLAIASLRRLIRANC